jgi:hypothetical protein
MIDRSSGKTDRLLPDRTVTQFEISGDERQVAFTTRTPAGVSEIWLATLDRSAPRGVLRRTLIKCSLADRGWSSGHSITRSTSSWPYEWMAAGCDGFWRRQLSASQTSHRTGDGPACSRRAPATLSQPPPSPFHWKLEHHTRRSVRVAPSNGAPTGSGCTSASRVATTRGRALPFHLDRANSRHRRSRACYQRRSKVLFRGEFDSSPGMWVRLSNPDATPRITPSSAATCSAISTGFLCTNTQANLRRRFLVQGLVTKRVWVTAAEEPAEAGGACPQKLRTPCCTERSTP